MYIPRRKDEDLQPGGVGPVSGDQDFEGLDFDGLDTEEAPEFLRSKSNLERMSHASDSYSKKAKDLIDRLLTAQDPGLIDRETLREVVHLQRERFYGCLSLPFSLAFFTFFALSAYLHEDITNVYMIESGLRKALGNNLGEVDNIPQLWNYLSQTLVPELFDQDDYFGNPEPNKTYWSRVLTYNQLQGPLVLSQSRSKKEPCQDGKGIIGDMICYPQKTTSTETFGRNVTFNVAPPNPQEYAGGNVTLAQREALYASSFSPASASKQRRLRLMRTEYMGWMPGGAADSDDEFRVLMYPNTWKSSIQEQLSYLFERGWLDAQSKQVQVKALLLNAEVGRPRLEQFQVLFRFSRGGGVFARMTLESLFLEFADGMMTLFFDFAWVTCLCFVTGLEIRNAVRSCKQKQCAKNCAKFWTILQWLIIVGGWLNVLGYLYQNSLRSTVRGDLKDVIDLHNKDIPAEGTTLGQDLNENTDAMLSMSSWFRILIAEYHLILMFRFFTAFHSQPRLGVVTSTLEASIVDIIHFLVVLLPTFMAYAISGCFIFGRRMEEFSNFNDAIGLCFKMAMEGEYDWDALSTEHYWTAALWTWTFMLLIVLLMLNMVLAIVMDVYTEMRKNAGQSETVLTTLKHFINSIWWSRSWVSYKDLIGKMEIMDRQLSREELLKIFPGMCEAQLKGLIHACRCQIEVASSQDTELKDSMKMTMAIKLAIDQVNEEINQLYENSNAEVDDYAMSKFEASTEKRGWLQETAEQMAAQNHWMLSVQWQLQQLQWQWQAIEAMHGTDVRFDNLKDSSTQNMEEQDIIL